MNGGSAPRFVSMECSEVVGPALRWMEHAQHTDGIIEHRVDDKVVYVGHDELAGAGHSAGSPQCLEVRKLAHLDEHCIEHTLWPTEGYPHL